MSLKTWREFAEARSMEKEEERSGIDVDLDHEKGEPEEHVEKFEKTRKEMLEFFHARKKGAAKIAAEAKAKGGASILTYWHFSAKSKPYDEVIKAIESNKPEAFFKSKCKGLLSRINCDMKQKEFQEIAGILEVFGEAMAQLFN